MGSAISSFAGDHGLEGRTPRAVLATFGHQLRTPLTAIRGYVETLLDGEFDAPTERRFLETVRREALRLGRLVDGMLEPPPDSATSADPSYDCNVVEQILATIDMLSPMARAARVTIRTRLPDAARARVDGDACVHALANLVENAIKYGGECGNIEISCASETPYIAIAVEDDGAGVAVESREKIFALGVRENANASFGRGIGLAVVKAVAESAGGDVRVEAATLGGARFVLRFLEG